MVVAAGGIEELGVAVGEDDVGGGVSVSGKFHWKI